MATLSIRIPDEILQRLEKMAIQTGRPKSFYAKQAVLSHLDDLEDIYVAEQRLTEVRAGRSQTHTLDEVESALGLAD
jgi:RHH-type transcriptional regulator, rel operon repressor / antitoxin RelB